jgi:hypothetical protein
VRLRPGLKESERERRNSMPGDDRDIEAFGKAARRHNCGASRADPTIC